jgi:hypothetical protein
MLSGSLITAEFPDHIVFKSNVQISGFNATTCSTRRIGCVSVVPGAATLGLRARMWRSPPSANRPLFRLTGALR